MLAASEAPRPVLDAHTHVGSLAESLDLPRDPQAASPGGAGRELSERLSTMDRRGVDQAVVIAGHGYLRPHGLADTRAVNDGIAAYRDAVPHRFPAAVGIVEPLYGADGFEELNRCREELGLVGISFHTRFQGVTIDSPWVRRYLQRMGELGLVPFVHALGEASDEQLAMVESVALDMRDLPMLVLDAFSTFAQSQLVTRVAERCPNLVFDTALSHGWGFIRPLVDACGPERLAYGSDLYSWPHNLAQSHMLEEIRASDLTDDAVAAITGGTARRLLGLAKQTVPPT